MMRRSRIEKAEVERRVIRWQMCTLKFESEVLAERWPAPPPASIGRLQNVSLYRKGFDKTWIHRPHGEHVVCFLSVCEVTGDGWVSLVWRVSTAASGIQTWAFILLPIEEWSCWMTYGRGWRCSVEKLKFSLLFQEQFARLTWVY